MNIEELEKELDRITGLWIKAQNQVHILTQALKQCRIYSECYDELIMTIDEALIYGAGSQPVEKKD